jgi:hypothetical protein
MPRQHKSADRSATDRKACRRQVARRPPQP